MTLERALSRPVTLSLCLIAAAVMAACGGGTSSDETALEAESESVSDIVQSAENAETDDTAVASLQLDADPLPEETGPADNFAEAANPDPTVRAQAISTAYLDNVTVFVNKALIPARAAGISTEKLKATTELPVPSNIGAFRTSCGYSHMAFDDPIVFPNQPGRSHLHTFFGNTGTNARSTARSIATKGNSTCRGGTANRTAYWVPSMVDTRTGTPIAPKSGAFYYKTGYNGIRPSDVQPLPQGLRMIAGDPKNKSASGPFGFDCKVPGATSNSGKQIPNCPAGSELRQTITFPQCWDGVNLDSPDHKSHMAYAAKGACPSTHPVPLTEITFRIIYDVKEANAPRHWRLSSDAYDRSLPGGYSSHGDWFNGWKQDVSDAWGKYCNQASVDCHSHLLGDGRRTY